MIPPAAHGEREQRLVIEKAARKLHLYVGTCLERSYSVALGRNWVADKAVEGDEATPVGEFYICSKNPRSKFFLSMCLSYPNAEDAERGLAAGLISPEEHGDILRRCARSGCRRNTRGSAERSTSMGRIPPLAPRLPRTGRAGVSRSTTARCNIFTSGSRSERPF